MLTIALPPETEDRLQGEAQRRGLEPAQYARRLIEAALIETPASQSSSDALARWEAMNETDDPEEIRRRQGEFEEFRQAVNRNRLDMEGPDARKVYP